MAAWMASMAETEKEHQGAQAGARGGRIGGSGGLSGPGGGGVGTIRRGNPFPSHQGTWRGELAVEEAAEVDQAVAPAAAARGPATTTKGNRSASTAFISSASNHISPRYFILLIHIYCKVCFFRVIYFLPVCAM
jgi:hypothetical protein